MDYYINSNLNDGILEIEFYNRKANSFNSEMLNELTITINNAATNQDVKVILLKSKGEKVFSAGASFDEMIEIEDFQTAKSFFLGFAKLINAMTNCPKFIVTLISGKAIGGSVGIASASDYVVATLDAEFRLSEYSVGIGPFVIAPVIEHKIGLSALMEMTIDTEYRNAKWANDKGLVNRIFENTKFAYDFAKELCSKISQRNPAAVKELKEIFWEKEAKDPNVFEQRAEKSAKLLLNDFTKNFLLEFKSK
jgi:methylglutaconyl-CoA hydratase